MIGVHELKERSERKVNWRNVRVLVTGAGGFIGSHLTERLVDLGAEVVAFVRYNSRGDCGHLDRIDPAIRRHLQIVSGDLRDPHALVQASQKVDFIFHLGALVSIPYSYVHPREVVKTEVIIARSVCHESTHRRSGKYRPPPPGKPAAY